MQPDHIKGFEAQGLSVTRIDNEKLSGVPRGARFNGAIVEWKGQRIMAYRRYNPLRVMRTTLPGTNGPSNVRDIAISVLDSNWVPTGEHHTVNNLPYRHGDECFEDPRLFVFQDALWMVCVMFLAQPGGCFCHQYLFRLDDKFQIAHIVKIHAGKNFGGVRDWEKNWTFFTSCEQYNHPSFIEGGLVQSQSLYEAHKVQKEKLHLLYNVQDMQTHEVDPKVGTVKGGSVDRKLIWPYGHMRGGTNPVRYGNYWLKFVHNSTDGEWSVTGGTRRYSMSAVLFETTPPFRIVKVSKEPICWGSRHEAFCGWGNSQCVFPAGVILENDVWHVSAGINDTYNAIFHLNPKKVLAGMVDAEEFYVPHARCFHGSKPNANLSIIGRQNKWCVTKAGGRGMEGVIQTDDPFTIAELLASDNAREISESEYLTARAKVDLPFLKQTENSPQTVK